MQVRDALPLNEKRQNAFLGHLLADEKFFRICVGRVTPEWWAGPEGEIRGKIYLAYSNFYKKYARVPASWDELKTTPEWRLAPHSEQSAMNRVLIESQTLRSDYLLDAIRDDLDDWYHSRLFTEAMGLAETKFNSGDTKGAYSLMAERIRAITTTSFQGSPAYDFSQLREHARRRQTEAKGALTIGYSLIDKILLPQGGGQGSLLKGDTTLIIAPTNAGKTTMGLAVAAANLRRNLEGIPTDVLIVTHEGEEGDIAEKLVMSVLNVNRDQYWKMCDSTAPQDIAWLDNASRLLQEHLVYLPMNKGGQTVESVIGRIRQAQDERVAARGRGFDLLVNDYPAKLLSENMKYQNFQKRNLDEYVYDQFVMLALELKFHAFLAIQANRTGNKINRGQKGFEERLLTPEDVNESFGPVQIATNVFTINRDHWSEHNDFMTLYLTKSRSGEKNVAITCKSKYSNGITHSESLGGFAYRGNAPVGPMADVFYNKYKGEILDPETMSLAASGAPPPKKIGSPTQHS